MGRFSKLEVHGPSSVPIEDPAARSQAEEAPQETEVDTKYSASGYLDQGDEVYFSGNEKQALRLYGRAMQADNSHLPAWVAQIQAQLLMGQLSEAKVWISRALTVFPNAPSLLALRAVGHAKSGMIRQAMGNSDIVLSETADDPNAWLARGHILILADNKNWNFCFEQALKFSAEREWKAPFLMGLILDRERLWGKAIKYYETALERRTTLPYAWVRISKCRQKLGQGDAAKRARRHAEVLVDDDDRLAAEIKNLNTSGGLGRLFSLFRRKR